MQALLVLAAVLGVAQCGPVDGDQQPKIWDALDQLRGKQLTVDQIQDLYGKAVAGTDYPILAEVPQPRSIDCGSKKGFYADSGAGKCQVFDRCDINGNLTSYLCPAETLFNQITLICDWWYNVDCSKSDQFAEYSNARLYADGQHLLDNQDVIAATGAVADAGGSPAPAAKKSKKARKSKA